MPIQRKIDKKDNYFSVEVKEGEEVHIKAGEDEVIFISPYDALLNCYLKRDIAPIHYKN